MITFVELGSLGRLGNQLFQYAAACGVSKKTGHELKRPPFESKEWHGQKCLLEHFNITAPALAETDYRQLKYRFIESDHMKFYPEVFEIEDYTDLYGFFQSTLYFKGYEDAVKSELTLKDPLRSAARRYVDNLRSSGHEIVSLHMRRGDNTDGTNIGAVNYYGADDTFQWDSLFGRYLSNAQKHFDGRKVKYLIFTGGSRFQNTNEKDIEWCKKNFHVNNILYSEGNSDIMDFAIMTACDHNITCHNTSFGWWAAYLNTNPEKIVVAPRDYFIEQVGRSREGFYPELWRLE